jgi:branched-chain amino acid transport system substrate-binding protein
VADFTKSYQDKFKEAPSYHSAGGYVAGLLIQKAIETAGTVDTAKVKAALDAMDLYTFYGRIKFDTAKAHGLQVGHDMIYTQWQKDAQGKLINQIVWPEASKTAAATVYRK